MAVHVFTDTTCPDLQMYVKQTFTMVLLECLWSVIICRSQTVSLIIDGNVLLGQLLSDPESITNICVLLKMILINGYLSVKNNQRLLEMRRDQCPSPPVGARRLRLVNADHLLWLPHTDQQPEPPTL